MAQNAYPSALPYHLYIPPAASVQYDLVNHGQTQGSHHRRHDHDRILEKLNTLASGNIPIEYILQLSQEPYRSACAYLLHQIEHGLDPSYLVDAVQSSNFGSGVVQPDCSKLSCHVLVTCDPRHSSWMSSGSGLSGDTICDSFDPQTPCSEVEQKQKITANPQATLPFRSAHHAGCAEQYHYQQPTSYQDFMFPTNVEERPESVFEKEVLETTPFTTWPNSGLEECQWNRNIAAPQAPSGYQNALRQSPSLSYSTPRSPYASFESADTPTSAHLTPQSSINESLRVTDTLPRARGAPGDGLLMPSSLSPAPACKPMKVKLYSMCPPKRVGYRSPCPYCTKDFVSLSEFICHVKAEHEQPTEFICKHPQTESHYCFRTTRESQLKRHHTKEHAASCNMPSTCCRKIAKAHQKQIWGCWFCNWTEETIDAWAEHHMKYHHKYNKRQMSFTWLVKSLLSQEATKHWWQQHIDNTVRSTEALWDFKWSADNPEILILVEALECGFYKDHDFRNDQRYQQELALAIMDEAEKTNLGPMSSGNKRAATSSPSGPKTFKSRILRPQSSKGTINHSSMVGLTEAAQSEVKRATIRHTRSHQRRSSKHSANELATNRGTSFGATYGI